jgi:S1-C subfamily serine protease
LADDDPELQARIDAARERLDAAAHELAQLHQQLYAQQPSQPQDTFQIALPAPAAHPRASLGLLLMPGNRDGVAIAGVTPGGGAAAAGVQAGDVLIALNGNNLQEPGAKPPGARVFELLEGVEPGDTVNVTYLRDGETQSTDIVAQEPMAAHTVGFAATNVAFAQGPGPGAPLGFGGRAMIGGLELFDLDETLGHYFGVSDGVLVLRTPGAGDAEGFRAGDVIRTVAGKPVASSADCLNAFSTNAYDVAAEVLRDGAVVSVSITGVSGGPALMPFPPQGGVRVMRMGVPATIQSEAAPSAGAAPSPKP